VPSSTSFHLLSATSAPAKGICWSCSSEPGQEKDKERKGMSGEAGKKAEWM